MPDYLGAHRSFPIQRFYFFQSSGRRRIVNDLNTLERFPESFPVPFIERYQALFNDTDFSRIVDGFSAPRQAWFRLNPLLPSSGNSFESVAAQNIEVFRSGDWPDSGWVEPENRQKLLESEEYLSGGLYLQGFASQLPVRMLDPQQGERILDLTAAPGSKTLQIAAMAPEAEIAAVELVRKRKFKLQDNLKRHGASFVKVFLQDGTKVWRYRPEHFDRVLLDAPCSSEGRFQFSDPHSWSFWTTGKSKEMVRKQRRLLFSAVHSLKPGGTLVYSTCAISPDENEGAIQHMLDTFGYCMDIEPISEQFEERIPVVRSWRKNEVEERVEGACRLLPSHRMEGFFVCRFRKTGPSEVPVMGGSKKRS